VHRDIKPANIFVTNGSQAKVLDFGLAKLGTPEWDAKKTSRSSFQTDDHLTSPGMAIGTAAYMSPEQVRGEETDARSDIFSFGAVLYEMATGRQPFSGATSGVIFDAILNRTPPPASLWNTAIPSALQEVIQKALFKDLSLRYQTIAEVRDHLKRIKQERDSGRLLASVSQGRPDLPGGTPATAGAYAAVTPDMATVSTGGAARSRSKTRRWVRATLSTAALLCLLSAAFLFFAPRTEYYPCVVIGDFRTAQEASVSPGLVEFAVKRALSQFPEIRVYDQREFGLARRLEKSLQPGKSNEEPAGFFARLAGRGQESRQPALRVTAELRQSMGELELNLDLTNRGSSEISTSRFRGMDMLVTKGVDEVVWKILEAYDPNFRRNQADGRYRPSVQLLSHHLDALRHYWRGAQAWNHLDMSLAEHELRAALEIDPTFALARLLLGEVRVFQNQWDVAQSEIAVAKEQAGSLTEVDRLRINALLARVSGKPFEERVQLERLIGLQRHRKEYVYELAESYFHTADVDEAIAKYQEALRLDENYALAYNHLGYCYSWKGEHANALQALTRYLELDPSPNAYDSLGDAYMSAGEYDKAIQAKSKAVEQDPSLYYAKRSLAFIEILRGRDRSAEEILKKLVVEAADDTQRARFQAALAFLYLRTGDLQSAASACERGLLLMGSARNDAPSDELAWVRGLIELERRNPAGANAALAQLRKMLDASSISAMNYKPVYKYWLHLLARIRASENRHAEAAQAMSDLKWVKDKLGYWSTPHDRAFLMDAIGSIYETIDSTADAEGAYRDALQYNPHYGLAHFHLARLLYESGRRPDARRELDVFLSEWKDADNDAPEVVAAQGLLQALSGN
jgi:tetratricopeptide (TPR) repeat protein